MEKIYRCYVEKKKGFDVSAKNLTKELSEVLNLPDVTIRIFNRYDLQNIPEEKLKLAIETVLSEKAADNYYEEELPDLTNPETSEAPKLLFAEPLQGLFDMRSDSCEQCIQALLGGKRPIARASKCYAVYGVTEAEFKKVKKYLINPLEQREASADKPKFLIGKTSAVKNEVPVIENFISMDEKALEELRNKLGLAMSFQDVVFMQNYMKSEGRNPTLTEVRIIDTYWSDHCRHTTFNTIIEKVDIRDKRALKAYEAFLNANGANKPVTLMNVATASMRDLKSRGALPMLDVSEENNACTIRVRNKGEDWLLFFKNETHNHPTEIEPFGGASTCIGGAIRDPLSGRGYVYQAMRITGAGNPLTPISETLAGKLPQRKLTITAAEGFSSYGNQIGLATDFVKEFYHEGYIAKRLETGAVLGAVPLSWVRREVPEAGDAVILIGGRTGRDGIGGATGSSKTHNVATVVESAAEVQKGNAPEERKLQRLFRNPNVARLIKRCNDFGAGGASVAIGELADGVEINLDAFLLKYEGLNSTEIAVSESQERMAVVIAKKDVSAFLKFAEAENIEAVLVAQITKEKRMTMTWKGGKVADISREFLNSNGAERKAEVLIEEYKSTPVNNSEIDFKKEALSLAKSLNFCSQRGLVERFDGSIGAGSVFMPFGGKKQLTETQVMAAFLPSSNSDKVSVMACGFDPVYSSEDCFGGGVFAVVTSIAKLIAVGTPIDTIHLTLQEFFPRLNKDPLRWGKPFAALLGAFSAQNGLKIAAIGGKDSMSGSFGELDVPPTLISFAVGVSEGASALISPEFKRAGNKVYILETPLNEDSLPDYEKLLLKWEDYSKLLTSGKILSSRVCEQGGIIGGVTKQCFGNAIGFKFEEAITKEEAFTENYKTSIIFETAEELSGYKLLGVTQKKPVIELRGEEVLLSELETAWEATLEPVFPVKTEDKGNVSPVVYKQKFIPRKGATFGKPKAVIPVFPGTNCEYDTALALEKAGGIAEIVLVRNLTPALLQESLVALEKAISVSQMIVFPGGFSGGDEPDGSGKFIVSLFRNKRLAETVNKLVKNKDGLILGICNGFQALIKLGLLPYGEVTVISENSPTLTFNRIGRHQSNYVNTRIASLKSPWLADCAINDVYAQPISHGEGRFVANEAMLNNLIQNGQVVFQYVDLNGVPSMDVRYNPNGSDLAIEGICSPDGRILGKMAHTERTGEFLAKNISGNKYLPLFENGVKYFK